MELCKSGSLLDHIDTGGLHTFLGVSPTAATLAEMVGFFDHVGINLSVDQEFARMMGMIT